MSSSNTNNSTDSENQPINTNISTNINTNNNNQSSNDKSSSQNSNLISNSELVAIKSSQQINLSNSNENKLSVEIPQRKSNYFPYEQDELIDINTEIDMITEELKENYFDDLLNKSDMSLLQIQSLIESGLIYFVEGLHVSLTGLIFIPIIKHYHLSLFNGCFVSSSLILFMAFGSLLSGFLTEKIFRKQLILFNLLIISTFSIISAVNSWKVLCMCRCVIGTALGIIIPITSNSLSEVLPQKFRSFWIIAVTIFFSFGAIVSCQLMKISIRNFGILFASISIPSSLIAILYIFYFKENPRYLILIGNYEEAYKLIEKYLILDHHKLSQYEKTQISKSIDKGVNKEVKFTGKFKFIFSRYLNITFILSSIWILYSIIINGGIFSMVVGLSSNATFISTKDNLFKSRNRKGIFTLIQIFYTFFAVSVIIAGLFTEIKCCGRKYTIFFGFLLSSIVSCYVLLSDGQTGLVYAVATCLINISFNAINSYTIEIYPTRVRDLAVGYLTFISKIIGFLSNIVAVWLQNENKKWVLYVNAIIGVLGVIFTLMLPFDTYRRKLDDILTKHAQTKTTELPIIGN